MLLSLTVHVTSRSAKLILYHSQSRCGTLRWSQGLCNAVAGVMAVPFVACCALGLCSSRTGCATSSWPSGQPMSQLRLAARTRCCTILNSWGQQLARLHAHKAMNITSHGIGGLPNHTTAYADTPAAIVLVLVMLLVLSVSFTSPNKTGVVTKLQAGRMGLRIRCLPYEEKGFAG